MIYSDLTLRSNMVSTIERALCKIDGIEGLNSHVMSEIARIIVEHIREVQSLQKESSIRLLKELMSNESYVEAIEKAIEIIKEQKDVI